tara:strand:+ start:1257 stop:1658 length:402 start_codon:yes stop_codon:yes gene_type:complete
MVLLNLLICNACSVSYKNSNNDSVLKDKELLTSKNSLRTYSGQVVSKTTETKGSKNPNQENYYFRLSTGDYFIKFCESDVTFNQIEPFIQNEFEIKSVTLEIKFKEGEWDNCKEVGYVQSRIGPYVVIKKILN